MSAKEAQPSEASCFPLPLDSSRWLQTAAMKDTDKSHGEKVEREEMDSLGKWQLRSLTTTTITGSTDVSEDSEPESPPPIVRRKVSFADAFGLNLVSIKEFSSQEEGKVENFLCGLDTDEYYLSCLFTPPSPDDLLEKVEEQKVALEAIALLPGTTTLRGTVRVANLCYQKNVYVRTTFDCWASHFDLLAEYIPGSSDGDTDGFGFRVTMVPPFQPEGLRVEFCLRYETSAGDFWESNNGMNYVLYCRKRELRETEERERRKVRKEKESKGKGKRSCLKASSKKSQPEPDDYTMAVTVDIPDSVSHKATQRATKKAVDNTERYASEECLQKTLVDSRRSRRRARMANVKDHFAKRETESQLGQFSNDEKNSHSTPTPENKAGTWSSSTPTSELWRKDFADPGTGKGQVLTYHEIPLQSLSWDRGSRHEDITNTSSSQSPWNGPFLEHQIEPIQNELDISTQGTHPTRVSKSNTIHAVEEHSNPIASLSQSSLNQSDLVQTAGSTEPVPMAQTELDQDDSQVIIQLQVSNPHVTGASSSSGMAEMQESVRHVIGDREHYELEGNPAADTAGKRSELECVTRAASRSDSALEAAEPDDHHQALCPPSSSDQIPQSRGSDGLEQVTNPRTRLDEAKTATVSSKEVTAWEILAPTEQSATDTTTKGTLLTARQTVSLASKNLPPHQPAQSSAEVITEAKSNTGAIETTGKIAPESTVMALREEETIAAEVTEAKKSYEGEPEKTQVSSPSLWMGEGSDGNEESVNSIAKVGGGESQDHVSPASGTVTFTDAGGATVREHAHPMRQWEEEKEEEEEEEEEEKDMTTERREREGEHPFKILNEREEYKESEEAERDRIIQKEGDLSQEMSRFKADRSDRSVKCETDRLKCEVSEEKREDQGVAEWKEEIEMCLGLRREQGYVNEPALYEQFTKATKGLEREHQRTSDSEMLAAAFGGEEEERCLMGDDSTATANSAQSEEEQRRVILAQGSEELQEVSPNDSIEEELDEVIPVPSIITVVDQHLAQDQYTPIPTPTLCSIQTTLGGQDPCLFHPDEMSPVLQVGATTWSTCAISAPLGDGHEIEVVLRHRRSPQPVECFQSPVEEAESHGQFPGIGAPSRGPEVVSPAPLSMWLSELCSSLGPVSRAALYAVLFAMFFLTAFVCDLPVCLAIYLFSLCWWCCHGEKQPLPRSKGVD